MVDISQFDTTTYEPRGDFEAIPAGTYEAEITESSIQPISKNDDKGDCIVLTWKIRGGSFDGRLIWQRLNLWFKGSEKTPGKVVDIARQQLSEIANACGRPGARSTEDIHYQPCLIRVAVQVDPSGNYPPRNEVKGAKPLGQGQSQQQRPAPQQQSHQQPRQQSASGGGWPRR
ncbi:hypothetical protein GCM10011390_41930 [Aureimonas endophytica]|uniref:DUF669 domain-containing protein n=1 Tax=Aureimonas endophytica TaxID=2027858 RepID=A0A916ZYZ5_9HYPH|nr:DUF669 domain-containing protein [Aureimonas endophytica]GGE18350.1 hypothetical protein GCM10011390_41930 [Aureimonas endophytica]